MKVICIYQNLKMLYLKAYLVSKRGLSVLTNKYQVSICFFGCENQMSRKT